LVSAIVEQQYELVERARLMASAFRQAPIVASSSFTGMATTIGRDSILTYLIYQLSVCNCIKQAFAKLTQN
jgi:hypothetical protein